MYIGSLINLTSDFMSKLYTFMKTLITYDVTIGTLQLNLLTCIFTFGVGAYASLLLYKLVKG